MAGYERHADEFIVYAKGVGKSVMLFSPRVHRFLCVKEDDSFRDGLEPSDPRFIYTEENQDVVTTNQRTKKVNDRCMFTMEQFFL